MKMTNTKNQVVVFDCVYGIKNYKAELTEARWSSKHNSFYLIDDDGTRVYSTKVEDKPKRNRKSFIPTKENCIKQIFPEGETEKAYKVCVGSNGHIGNPKLYYDYIAKSICYVDETGKIFAPVWATRF